jgi:preprotein translocase subunit SecY
MTEIDAYTAGMGGGMLVLSVIAGWSTTRYELDMTQQWRITKYASAVLALVLGFGFCQLLAGQLAASRGMAPDGIFVVLAGAFAGSFLVMWIAQAAEYATRRAYGLEPMPYRLVRFDLFRW